MALRRNCRSNLWQLETAIAAVEQLENRSLLSAASALAGLTAHPTVEVQVQPAATSAAAAPYTPSQMQTAYGFNQVSFSNGANGTGQTIGIIDAYDDPTIQNDLKAFDNAYGLPAANLTVMSQNGSTTTLPSADPTKNTQDDWEVEEALDVEWAHALAPGANIVLVEANSAGYSDLFTAIETAENLPGVSVVSMSWSGQEFAVESLWDSYFTTPTGHKGVTFVASSGDSGEPSGYPAYSPNVLAVGGTTLNISSSGSYISETGWADSGGGKSLYELQPSYQSGIVSSQSKTQRTAPDVAFDANPNTGVDVYDSYGNSNPWMQVGGTSLSAPSWAAVISIVDQGRVQNGLGTLDGTSQTLPMLYQLSQTNPSAFHDITTGNNGFPAGVGYDLVTGLGSPNVSAIVAGLDGSTTTPTTNHLIYQQWQSTGTAGQALSTLYVVVENASNQVVKTNNSTVTLTIYSGPAGFATSSTVTAQAINGIATFKNLVFNTAGTYRVRASDSGITGDTSPYITVSPAAASKIVFQQVPTTGIAGQTLSTVTVAIEDAYGNVITSNNSSVTLSVASGPASLTSGSTTTVTAVNGIATFKNLTLATAGSYTLSVTDSGLSSVTSGSLTISSPSSSGFQLVAQVLSSTTVELSWTPVLGTEGYRVLQIEGTTTYLLGTLPFTMSSVEITGLASGTSYQFQIQAFRGPLVADSNTINVNTASSATRFQTANSDDWWSSPDQFW